MTSAPSIESVRTTDTDEAAAIEASFGYGLRMTSLEMTFGFDLIAGDMATATETFVGADLSAEVEPIPGPMFLTLNAGRYSFTPWGTAREFTSGDSFIVAPGMPMDFHVRHPAFSMLSFAPGVFERVVRDVFDAEWPLVRKGALEPVDEYWCAYWPEHVRFYRTHVLEQADVYGHDLLREQATRALLVSAVSAFGLLPPPQRMTASRHPGVGRAIAYIDEHLQEPLTTQDIATAARMTTRGLHLAFRRERDQTPMEYVRAGRIAGAHADLVPADPTSTSVGDIAAAWGFTNRGRFARAYMATYGQSPSTTLRQ